MYTKCLFLDDERVPYVKNPAINDISAYHYTNFTPFKDENWDIVRNYNDFISYIENNDISNLLVSFDHDLGDVKKFSTFDNEKTGYDCAKWLCDYCQDNNIKFPDYFVHSMNPTGKQNITTYIENYKKVVEWRK